MIQLLNKLNLLVLSMDRTVDTTRIERELPVKRSHGLLTLPAKKKMHSMQESYFVFPLDNIVLGIQSL